MDGSESEMKSASHEVTPKPVTPQAGDEFRHPFSFSPAKKIYIVIAALSWMLNATFGSSLPSGASDAISEYFDIPSGSTKLVLPTSLYLVGFAVGPLIFGPLSEHLGRKPVLVGTCFGYLAFTLGCALSPTFGALLAFRLLAGINAACPNAVLGGLYADILESPRTRGNAMALFMVCTAFGPQLAPLISGFISTISWRWTFWVGLIAGGVTFPLLLMIPETYVPVLRKRQLKKSGHVVETSSVVDFQSKAHQRDGIMVFTRPFVMIYQEPILLFSSLFMGFTYAIFYLYFEAYPIVFQDFYGLSPGVAGLAFLPISVGAVFAFITFLVYGAYYDRACKAGKEWTTVEEYRRLPLAAVGAPLLPIAMFWLGWSTKSYIHPVVPMMSGVVFGMGYILIFMSMINYLTDAYKQYSASAQAAASTVRSTMAVCLPLATSTMYGNLGISWATSMLAFISLALAIIPFVFMKYGAWLRAKSTFSQQIMGITQR